MPEFETTYRGRRAIVELYKNGMVKDIYPVDKGDSFIVTEDNKIAFEIDYYAKIQDVMAEYESEIIELKRSRGRDRLSE